ncbi:MAG: ATP-binding protein, partial [Magnetococcus sp. YQC-3]
LRPSVSVVFMLWSIAYVGYPMHGLVIISIALVLVVTGYLLSVIFYGTILKPIQKLTEQAHGIAHGDYDCDISLSGCDEIGVLARHLQQMKETLQRANRTLERKVEHRTQMLTQANSDLKHSLEQLEKTRDELLQSEKAASLGRLVAGFAHEINTPIGIGVGSISALPEYVGRLESLLAADEVDGDRLDEVMGKIREMSSLCLTNLRQVSELVARFKRTSVDQTSEQPRRFNVHELLLDVQSTLQHIFRHSSVEIVIDCPADIVVLSQPGALGQVLTNLLLNSLKHGFEEGTRAGSIAINVQCKTKHDKLLVIWFADNGNGMESSVLKHVFEPFFTTAKGRGGSGLGLYICHNIVRNQLKGKIVCTSISGQMTSFLLEIPVPEG